MTDGKVALKDGKSHMFGRRHVLEEPRHLKGADKAASDPADRVDLRHHLAAEANLAGIGREITGHEVDEGGLAGAVRADQRDAIAWGHRERDIIGDGKAAEGFLEIGDFEDRAHERCSLRRLTKAADVP